MTRILFVESGDEAGAAVADTLRGSGFDVFDIRDGRDISRRVRDALLADAAATPTAVLADVGPRHPCGRGVVRAVRDCDLPVPVILAASAGDRDTGAAGYAYGADAVVNRPLDADQVLAALQLVLSHHSD